MAEGDLDEGQFKTDINLYEKSRPGYTRESAEFLLDKLGALSETSKPLTILELGAGTGKFTRVLVDVLKRARSNVRIIASDPQALMCKKFKEVVPGVEILHCKAEDIKLPNASVDLVLAAQAFHWFANTEALTEIHRILAPRGKIGAIWNIRNYWEVDWVAKMEDILTPYYKKYEYPGGFEMCRSFIKECKLFIQVDVNTDLVNYLGPLTADELVDMFMTISSVHKCSKEEKRDVELNIRDLLGNHSDVKGNTEFILPYKVCMLWSTKV